MRFLKQGILLKPVMAVGRKNWLVWLTACLMTLVLILWTPTSFAEECIIKHDSHIKINEDTSIAVTGSNCMTQPLTARR